MNEEVSLLGKQVSGWASPDEAKIECAHAPAGDYVARFTCPEFTSICPVTGQPDFATIVIEYVPDMWIVESKALKLFLHSFRNHGAFHEACVVDIGTRLSDACRPVWMRVAGYFMPRGGIPIDVFWEYGTMPAGVWMPPHNIGLYRGR